MEGKFVKVKHVLLMLVCISGSLFSLLRLLTQHNLSGLTTTLYVLGFIAFGIPAVLLLREYRSNFPTTKGRTQHLVQGQMRSQVQCPNCGSYKTYERGVKFWHILALGAFTLGLSVVIHLPYYLIEKSVKRNDPGKRYKCENCEYKWMQ